MYDIIGDVRDVAERRIAGGYVTPGALANTENGINGSASVSTQPVGNCHIQVEWTSNGVLVSVYRGPEALDTVDSITTSPTAKKILEDKINALWVNPTIMSVV